MILIYSVLRMGNIGYQLQLLDLQDLKTKLQIELNDYNEKNYYKGGIKSFYWKALKKDSKVN